MRAYEQDFYYFFKLSFDCYPQQSNIKYRIEKNNNFNGFYFLKKAILEFKKLKESVSNQKKENLNDKTIIFFIRKVLNEQKQIIDNYYLKYNKNIRISSVKLERSIVPKLEKKEINFSAVFEQFQLDFSKNISLIIEELETYISTGEAFLKEESGNSFLFVNVSINNYKIETTEVDLCGRILINNQLNNCLFTEISQYFKNIYTNNFKHELDILQQELIDLFYSFKKENVFNTLSKLDLLFLKKSKLTQEQDLFYSLAPNFLLALIEKFRDASKNIKRKIIVIKKYSHSTNMGTKSKIKLLIERYIMSLFLMTMEDFLSIKQKDFLKFIKQNKPLKELPETEYSLPYDYICLIYKGILSNINVKIKLLCFPLTKGSFNSTYDYFMLKREYYTNKRKFNQKMQIHSNHNFFGNINTYPLLKREYLSLNISRNEHRQKIPFNINMNFVKDIYLIESRYYDKVA